MRIFAVSFQYTAEASPIRSIDKNIKPKQKKYTIMTKKIFSVAFAVATLLFSGCAKEQKEQLKPVTPAGTLINILKADYKTVIEQYPGVDSGFVEAQCTLSHPITQVASADEVEIVSLREVFYKYHTDERQSHLVFVDRDFVNGTSDIRFETHRAPWFGDHLMARLALDSMISLTSAIQHAMSSGIGLPATRYITLRYPVYLVDKGHAMYVFGGETPDGKHMWVDSFNGDVLMVEDAIDDY